MVDPEGWLVTGMFPYAQQAIRKSVRAARSRPAPPVYHSPAPWQRPRPYSQPQRQHGTGQATDVGMGRRPGWLAQKNERRKCRQPDVCRLRRSCTPTRSSGKESGTSVSKLRSCRVRKPPAVMRTRASPKRTYDPVSPRTTRSVGRIPRPGSASPAYRFPIGASPQPTAGRQGCATRDDHYPPPVHPVDDRLGDRQDEYSTYERQRPEPAEIGEPTGPDQQPDR